MRMRIPGCRSPAPNLFRELQKGAFLHFYQRLVRLSWVFQGTGALRGVPGLQGLWHPEKKAAHGDSQRKVSWRPSQPGICPGGGRATTKAGRDCSQGRGRGGRER